MKAVLQVVKSSSVIVGEETVGEIGKGLNVLLGIAEGDTEKEVSFLADKIAKLRIFTDENGKMNLSLLDVEGEMIVISNFTLCADASHGRRPAYTDAMRPEGANALYERFIGEVKALGVKKVAHGQFGADMEVRIRGDGPVTIVLDTDVIMKK